MKIAKIGILALILVVLVGSAFAFFGRNEAAREAMEAGNYQGWKNAITAELTEERFNQMRNRHQEMLEHREAVEAAIEAGDYNAWKQAMEDDPRGRIADVITEENFDTFVQMHNARMEGDHETANALAEELGLNCGIGNGIRRGFKRFH